ncbi:hypothetical protein HYDPIDRAFT_97134 [Hydnomerulius pinastri MD-312]|uniref:Unplaced genomic scaffold scaffold_30, whole genome shotgun sequence n=1 Tax=Hydnomerulius pinastri MD-312 TaxID=994086 RepID=A0A0C9V6N6_9AGAM|nr:hypothetical protein HYDPIDRAFT_97134 [Hydnomerulius pinastri MD-312]
MVAEHAVVVTGTRRFIPQSVYRPYSDDHWLRYVREVQLKEPIFFYSSQPVEWGVSLEDALKARPEYLKDKDERMFIGCGPSVSIRLQWPGYHPWAKQISTMEFKTPKQPITKAKLAKNIANCVRHFIEIEKQAMDADVNRRWRVGKRNIKVEDLMLVSLHHVSKGSWQPQLRLRRPLLELALPHHQDSTFASSSAS